MPYRKPISYLIRVQNIIQGKVSSPFIIRGARVSLAFIAGLWLVRRPQPRASDWLLWISLDYLAIVCGVWLLKSGFLYKHLSNKKRGLPALYSISPARSFNEKSLINNSFFKDTNPKSSIQIKTIRLREFFVVCFTFSLLFVSVWCKKEIIFQSSPNC